MRVRGGNKARAVEASINVGNEDGYGGGQGRWGRSAAGRWWSRRPAVACGRVVDAAGVGGSLD